MSRSGYSEEGDDDHWAMIRWRGAVVSALRGRRGQAFLKEMLAALDALPDKRLIAEELVIEGEVCALGAVCRSRGIDVSNVVNDDYHRIARMLDVPRALAQEIMWENDEAIAYWRDETPEHRFTRMREWIASQIKS